jgi:hypothetical protein
MWLVAAVTNHNLSVRQIRFAHRGLLRCWRRLRRLRLSTTTSSKDPPRIGSPALGELPNRLRAVLAVAYVEEQQCCTNQHPRQFRSRYWERFLYPPTKHIRGTSNDRTRQSQARGRVIASSGLGGFPTATIRTGLGIFRYLPPALPALLDCHRSTRQRPKSLLLGLRGVHRQRRAELPTGGSGPPQDIADSAMCRALNKRYEARCSAKLPDIDTAVLCEPK